MTRSCECPRMTQHTTHRPNACVSPPNPRPSNNNATHANTRTYRCPARQCQAHTSYLPYLPTYLPFIHCNCKTTSTHGDVPSSGTPMSSSRSKRPKRRRAGSICGFCVGVGGRHLFVCKDQRGEQGGEKEYRRGHHTPRSNHPPSLLYTTDTLFRDKEHATWFGRLVAAMTTTLEVGLIPSRSVSIWETMRRSTCCDGGGGGMGV